MAIICSLTAPFFWTFKAYYCRKAINESHFTSTMDLAIDHQLALGGVLTLIYITFLASGNDFDWLELVTGSATGVLFTLGAVLHMFAYDSGPGGPISALSSSQIIYQTLLTALFFGQSLSLFQFIGISLGISATLVIAIGEDIVKKCRA